MSDLEAENAKLREELAKINAKLLDLLAQVEKTHERVSRDVAKFVASHEAMREALIEACAIADRYVPDWPAPQPVDAVRTTCGVLT